MRLYTFALFAHILGVLSLFIGMGLQWTITLRLRQARSIVQVREWSSLIGGVAKLGPVSGALILVMGIYMTLTSWGMGTPWIVVSLAAMLFMLALGMGVITRRLNAIQRAAAIVETPTGAIPPELHQQIHNPLLWISTQLASGTALGVVFLMTTKPGLGGSLLVMGVALILGGITGGLSAQPSRTPRAAAIAIEEARPGSMRS
ncbi:MAG TPA: hypothetical protein VKQ30_17015 [Ktedonobacterales bacterium]|nr:hypothetical protein [Ktedonobacterales bacterium]